MSHTMIVNRRFGEELDIREFVQPETWPIRQLAERGPKDRQAFLRWAWAYVVDRIAYPPGAIPWNDRHVLEAYLTPARWFPGVARRYQTVEFWSFPAETLRDKIGDCEDRVFVLVSLLRQVYGPDEVFCSAGMYGDIGHMWVSVRENGGAWTVLETTYDPPLRAVPRPEGPPYRLFLRFNDEQVIVVEKAEISRIGRVGH